MLRQWSPPKWAESKAVAPGERAGAAARWAGAAEGVARINEATAEATAAVMERRMGMARICGMEERNVGMDQTRPEYITPRNNLRARRRQGVAPRLLRLVVLVRETVRAESQLVRERLVDVAVKSAGVDGPEVMEIEWRPSEYTVGIAGEFVIVEAYRR